MSRGPGRIERAIRHLFDTSPSLAFITDELCEHCYPNQRPIQRKHQVAVLRAAWNVIDDDPDWDAWRIDGMGRGYVFVNRADAHSFAQGEIIAGMPGNDYIYRSPGRAQRRPFIWKRAGPGFRVKEPDEFERTYIPDRSQLATLSAWPRNAAVTHVADHIAWRDGDAEIRAALQAKWEATLEYGRRLGRAVLFDEPVDDKRYEAADVGDNETLNALAKRLRLLATQNDPDTIRNGLTEVADALDHITRR